MKKNMLILAVLMLITRLVYAQTASVGFAEQKHSTMSSSLNTDFKEAIKIEPFIGFSASFATGSYIDYQKSFHGVTEQESVIKGAIQPILLGTLGLRARYQMFSDDALSPLQLCLGLQYQQRGFINSFESTYTSPANYTDLTKYVETYRLNYLSIPIQARWGNKLFADLGFSIDRYISGSRKQKVDREQSGAGAIDNGFTGSATEKRGLLATEIKKSTTALVVGGGIQGNKSSLALQANLSSKTFTALSDNFRNITIQLIFSKTL